MKKSVITLLIFLIMIISVSAVSAADDATDLGASDDATISVANTDTAVTADGDAKNFTELSNAIAGATGDLTLSSDYKRNGSESAIAIDKDINIDGNGSTIDGADGDVIFTITGGKTVTLKNMVLKNVNNDNAIRNHGTLTLDNVTFNNVDYNAIDSYADLTVKNCVFESVPGGIDSRGGALYLSNNTIDVSLPAKAIAVLWQGTLTSPSTVKVDAGIGSTFKEILYNAKAYDDNNNFIYIDLNVGTWTLGINDGIVDPGWAEGGINGTVQAKRYGKQVINATNTALTNATIETANVTVAPTNAVTVIEFNYEPNDPVWNDTVTLTVTIKNYTDTTLGDLAPTGTVNLTINSAEPVTVELVNGSAKYAIKNVNVGDYSVRIDYSGDSVFPYAYTVENFYVNKRAPEINVTVDNSTVGKQVITIILPSDVVGTVNATIEGFAQSLTNAELTDGKVTFNTELPARDDAPYVIMIDYAPSDADFKYAAASANINFYAGRFTTNITIDVENTTYGNNASFTITVEKGVNNATVIVSDATAAQIYNKIINFTDGSATIDLGVIPASDKYTISVTTEANGEYLSCSNETDFKVAQATPVIEITVGEHVLFEDVNVTVTVKNTKSGDIHLTDIGFDDTLPLNVNGTVTFTYKLESAGDHFINVEFTPTDVNYTNGEANTTFNVAKLTPEITAKLGYITHFNETAYIDVNLTNWGLGGNPAPTGTILVMMGDEPIASGDLTDGTASVGIPASWLPAIGEYTVGVYYLLGDSNYNPNSTKFTFNVVKWDVEFDTEVANYTIYDDVLLNVTANYGDTDEPAFTNKFTVVIKDSDNVPVNSTTISLVSGVPTTLSYKLPAGVYTLYVSYEGDDYHNANSTTSDVFDVRKVIQNLTIVVDNVTYPNKAVAVVNSSADGNYNVTVNDKNYTVEVKNGIGKVELESLAPEEYTASVISLMDDYVTETNTTTFKVEKGTIVANFTIPNVVYGDNITAFVTANVDGDYVIQYGTMPVTTVTVVNGTGNATVSYLLNVGQYTIDLYAPANDNYTNSEKLVNSTTFNITNATNTVIVTIDDVNYPNHAVVIINATADGEYKVNVTGDQEYTLIVQDGYANETLNLLIPGTYNVTVTATIPNYNPVKVNKNFTVNKGNIEFCIIMDDYLSYPNNATGTLITNVPGINATKLYGYLITVEGTKIKFNINGNETDKYFTLPTVLAPGNYTIKVTPKAKDDAFKYYNVNESSIFNTTTFEVKQGDITVSIYVGDVNYPENATANIYTTVAGNYTLTMVGLFKNLVITKEVTLVAGDNNVDVPGLIVDVYSATVTSTDANYTTATDSCNFNVNNGNIDLDLDATDVYFGDPVVVSIENSNADGIFTALVNGVNYTINVVNGSGNVTIYDVLYVGDYYIKLTADIDNFNPYVYDHKKFSVDAAPVNLTVEVTTVDYPNQAVATVFANATGVYNVTVEGFTYEVPINTPAGVMANASVVIDLLAVKDYSATVTKVDDDDNFTAADAYATFSITKGTPEIIIKVLESYNVLDNVTIEITVPYGTGALNITDSLLGNLDPAKQLENNSAKITIEGVIAIGTHVIYVELYDDNFTKTLNQTKFEVTKITTGFNITNETYVYEDDVIISLNITGLLDGVLPDGQVIIVDYGTQAASNDTITFNLGQLAGGVHTLNITYTGDNDHYASYSELYNITVDKFTPTVNATATGALYPENATIEFISNRTGNFTIYVVDVDGNLVQNISVGIVENDTLKTVGIEGLTAGKYYGYVVYNPNENYTAAVNATEFKIIKAIVDIDANVIPATYPNKAVVEVIATQSGAYTIVVTDKDGNIVDNQTGSLVANETAIAELGLINAGDYTVTVTYDNDNYSAEPVVKNLTISKGVPVITIEVANATYPETAVVNVTCSADGKYTVIVGTFTAKGNFTAGEVETIPVDLIGANTYDVIVVYAGSDNYNETIETGSLTIEKGTPEIFIIVDTTVALENATLLVGIPYATGSQVTINGINVDLVDYMGLGEYALYNVGILMPGVYNFTAVYAGDANLTVANETLSFTVDKLPSNLTVQVTNTTYGLDPIMSITLDNKDDVIVDISIDGVSEGSIVVSNGSEVLPILNLGAGEHYVTVTCRESDIYKSESQTVYFTIGKSGINLEVSATGGVYPAPITVTVKTDFAGEYNLTIGTSTELITLEANVAKDFTFTGMNAGTYEVTVSRAETPDTSAVSKSVNVTIDKANVTMTITSSDVTYPSDVVVTVTSDVDGTYSLFLDTTSPTELTLVAGVAQDVTFSGLSVGTYKFTLAFVGSENYNVATESVTVNVNKAGNTTITVEATSPVAGENATVTVTLPADATGTVSVKYGNGVYTAPVENGTAVVSVPTTIAGTENATVQYSGDENYDPASATVEITVEAKARLIAENITRAVNSPYDYYATLVDANGNPIGDVEITFIIAGETYKAKTNASGIATVSAGLVDNAKPYDVVVINPFTLENITATTTIVPRLIVISGTLTADYLENPPYVVQVIGDDGNPVGEGVYVEIVFAKKTYNMTTNATGHVVRTIGLAPGQYGVYARYQGYRTDQTVFIVNQVLKATSGTLKKTAKTYTLKATLKHTNGKAIANKVVKLTFNGKTYNVKTNSKGVASKTIKSSVIKNLKAGKTYTLKARYVNDVVKGKIKVVSK